LALGFGEWLGAAGLKLGDFASFTLELGQGGFQPGFEGAGDEAVRGLAGVKLALARLASNSARSTWSRCPCRRSLCWRWARRSPRCWHAPRRGW
jgi:hypothetical protein